MRIVTRRINNHITARFLDWPVGASVTIVTDSNDAEEHRSVAVRLAGRYIPPQHEMYVSLPVTPVDGGHCFDVQYITAPQGAEGRTR